MRHSRLNLMVLSWLTLAVTATASRTFAQSKTAVQPAITVIAPSTDEIFKDLKFALDLAGDDKGFETLKDTVETFLVGVDTVERGGVRIYPTANGLQMVITLPIVADPLKYDLNGKKLPAAEIRRRWPGLDKMPAAQKQALQVAELKKLKPADVQKLKDAAFADMISNLWDLDVKTAPAPSAALARQIPGSVKTRLGNLKLAPHERLIFGLTDGFLSYESGHVHLATKLEDVRLAKGGLPADLVKGHDLVVFIDGKAQSPEERKTAFDKAKVELVGAITQGEKESETVFKIRKAATEHQFAEIERFFVEGSRIHIGWNVSDEKKHARLEIEIEGLPNTALEQSIDLLGQFPDDFAGVTKDGAVLSLSGNFPLDTLRNEFLKTLSKLGRDHAKKEIDATSHTEEQKKADGVLADLVFDVVDLQGVVPFFNGFIRCWSNDDGTLTSVGAGSIAGGARKKIEDILQQIKACDPNVTIEEKIETIEEVEIHKLTTVEWQKIYPEIIGKDGVVFAGLNDKTLWLASGDKSQERLKKAIADAKAAGPKEGPGVDFFLKFGPFVGALDKYRQRNPVVAAAVEEVKPKAGGSSEKTPKAAKAKPKVEGLISGAELRKIALETFKDDKDTMTASLERQGKVAKMEVQFDETLIRYVGKIISKIVKENLADE